MNKTALAIALSAPLLATAETPFQVSGFGTLGLVAVDSDLYGYRYDIGQDDGTFKDDFKLKTTSVLGLQLDYSAGDTVDVVYQAVYRDQPDLTLDTATSMAFIRYSPSAAWSFRAGRTPLDLYLLTEYRDVGFAYTWAHPPLEVYGLVPYRALDGVDVTYSTRIKDLSFRSKLYMGKSESPISLNELTEIVNLDNIFGLAVSLDSHNWNLQSRYTRVKIVDDPQSTLDVNNALLLLDEYLEGFDSIWPDVEATTESMILENAVVEYWTLGGSYEIAQWEVMGEFARVESDSEIVPDLNGYYASVAYHWGDHSFFTIYAKTDSDNYDMEALGVDLNGLAEIPRGLELYQAVEFKLNFYASNQATTSLGWRWNLKSNIALKLQWDHTRIDEKGSTLWLNTDIFSSPKETVNAVFLNLSFVF